VVYKGKVTYAVFGDEGPDDLIGEGSIQLLRALGEERLKPNGRILNAGAGPDIVTIVFPGSGQPAHRKNESTLLAAIQSEGATRFAAMTS
jgi:Fungal chitosanase of glycosyl hydrolase group 75